MSIDGQSMAPKVSYSRTVALFLRGLGVIYFVNFCSWLTQLSGLVSESGLMPAKEFLARYAAESKVAWLTMPTLFWISDSGLFINIILIIGIIFSLLLISGRRHIGILSALWVIELSVRNSNNAIMNVWDNLLVAVSLYSILMSSTNFRSNELGEPSRPTIFVFKAIFFQVMFMMSFVKIFSNDSSWIDLTYLKYFFQNQPMPSALSWWAYQLPMPILKIMSALVLVVEPLICFAIFLPQSWGKARQAAFYISVGLQLFILAAGNFGFFNLLMIVLSLLMLDDSHLPPLLNKLAERFYHSQPILKPARNKIIIQTFFLIFLFFAAAIPNFIVDYQMMALKDWDHRVRGDLEYRCQWLPKIDISETPFVNLMSLHLADDFGVFGEIQRQRIGVRIYGSNDGLSWQLMPLFYSPDQAKVAPSSVSPFQSRLDHSLYRINDLIGSRERMGEDNYRRQVHFLNRIAKAIVAGRIDALRLFKKNPYSARPPLHVRFDLVELEFTSFSQWVKTGDWWRVTPRESLLQL